MKDTTIYKDIDDVNKRIRKAAKKIYGALKELPHGQSIAILESIKLDIISNTGMIDSIGNNKFGNNK